MRKLLLLFLALLVSRAICYAQLTTVIDETFKDNNKKWIFSNAKPEGEAEIKKGGYYVQCKLTGKYYMVSFPKIDYNANSDFTLSFTVEWISGLNNNSYGIYWGNNKTNKYTYFYISANGSFGLTQKGIVPATTKAWTKSSAINKQGENKIKIVCKNKHYDFYINDVNVYSAAITMPEDGDFYFKVNEPQQVVFDDVHLEQTVTANTQATNAELTEKKSAPPSSSLTTCKKENRNADETRYDNGLMPDEDILKLAPEKQLLDYYNKNGVCVKINPLWVKNKSNEMGSFLSLNFDKLEKLKSTFPFQLNKLKYPSFMLSIASNDETIEANRIRLEQVIHDALQRYLSSMRKELTQEDWQNKWQKQLIKEENFTTDAGENATILIYNSVSVDYVDINTNEANVTTQYYMRLMVPQPDKKLLQCSIEFSTTLYQQKTLPVDPLELKFFTADDEQKCLDFFKYLFKTISRAK